MQKNDQQSNITVAIRIRPLNIRQTNSGDFDIVRVQDNLIIILDPLDAELEQKKISDVLHRSKQQRYAFDKIYRNQSSQMIYFETTQQLIKTVLNGFNATVFAYGPTGTGKTYTMLGNQDIYGLNVLAIRDIFQKINQDYDNKYEIYITYVEIYNQMIRDLLVASSVYLQLRDDPQKGVIISGVTQFSAESTQQVMNLLLMGNRRRTTQSTNANQTSSRSHAVFQINISKFSKIKNTKIQTLIGKLSLIDLAGSQRGTVTENRGIRLMQGAKINRSLLALANCINALGDKNKKGFFVPYRDSKLTRLLKDSLGGNCKTVMIVNVSPSSSQFQETINTLKYANRAKNIKTKAITNKKLVALHISQYKNIINDLHREIEELKIRLNNTNNQEQENSIGNNGIYRDKLPRIQSRHGKDTINSNGLCSICGRMDEKEEIKSIKEQIFENFNERIQLRRAMMQIEQQNAMNLLQIRKKYGEIMLLKKTQNWQQNIQIYQTIKQLNHTISTLKQSTNKNILKKEITNLQIMQSMTATKKIRDDIMNKIYSKENRDTLQIIIKNHVLQLQNIELQINLQIQQRMINDMKQIIQSQRNIFIQNNIETLAIQDDNLIGDQLEIQLQQQQNQQDDQVFDQYDDQIQMQSYRNLEFARKPIINRQNSAKKEISQKKRKNQKYNNNDQMQFKKKDNNNYNNNNNMFRDRSIEKQQQQQQIGDFSLKGHKINTRKKK